MKERLKFFCVAIISGIVCSALSVYATITYTANQITYTKTNNQEVTLDSALNELYASANNQVYSGTYTFTPSSTVQTISTKDKLLKNNITINAAPEKVKSFTVCGNESTPKTINTNFKTNYISCSILNVGGINQLIIYNKNISTSKAYRINSVRDDITDISKMNANARSSDTPVDLANYFTINNNNLIINFNPSWIGNDKCYSCVAAN